MSEFKYTPPSYEIADSLLALAQNIELGKQRFTLPSAAFLREAANRVQRQHDEIERLRAMLREIAAPTRGDPSKQRFQRIAREALDE